MEFRQFKYVLKVAEERNFSSAAKKLFISQPSLSQFIQKVEEQIGAPLFDRSVSPLKLTYIGQLYIENAKVIMDAQHQFERQVEDVLNIKKGRVTVGCSMFRSAYLIAQVLPLFRQKYPSIEIILKEENTRHLEDMVLTGEIDLSISLLPIDEKQFDFEFLFQEKMLLAIPPEHHIAKRLSLRAGDHSHTPLVCLSEFKNTPFIQMTKDHKLHKMLHTLCEQAGFSPNVVFQTESMITAQALSGAGIGATLLPSTLVEEEHFEREPCYCELETKASRDVVVIYRKDRYQSRASKAFIEELKNYVAAK